MSSDKYVTDWPDHKIIDSCSTDLIIEHKINVFNVFLDQGHHQRKPFTTNIPYRGDVSVPLMQAILEIAESAHARGYEKGKRDKQNEIKNALGVK